jgi:hypothetical protein
VHVVVDLAAGLGERVVGQPVGRAGCLVGVVLDEPDRDVEVEGDREALLSAAVGCQLTVTEELKGAAEGEVDASAPLVDEFKFWAGLREQLTPVEVA